jgi:hypothetical protein
MLLFSNFGHWWMHVELTHGGAAGKVIDGVSGSCGPCANPNQSRGKSLGHGFDHFVIWL